jgi:hypothetical protein
VSATAPASVVRKADARPWRAPVGVPAPLDEREFLPALRAIERSRRLAPQLAMLARLHTALGAIAVASAALSLAIGTVVALLSGAPLPEVAGIAGGIAGALALLGAPWLALGHGLRRRRRWARRLGFACGLLLLPLAPFGTALGVWTLVVLAGWQPRLAEVTPG